MTLTTLEHQYRIVNPIHFNPKYDLATRFESVEKTLSEERAKIDGQRAGEKEDANKQSTQTLTIRSLKRREAKDGMMEIFNSGDWTQALGSSDFCITISQQQELSSR